MNTTSFCRVKSRRHRQRNTADSKCFLPVKRRHAVRPRQTPCVPVTAAERSPTGEGGVSVQLAYAFLQQAQTERQHGGLVEQVEHDVVARELVRRNLLALKLHHLLDEVRGLRLVVPQQLMENLQDGVRHFPLKNPQATI